MRIALLYDPWLLSARGSLDLEDYRNDPRGLSGSEMCAVRLFEELGREHPVTLFTASKNGRGAWERRGEQEYDLAISINCPDPLRDVKAKHKTVYALLNDFSFCKAGFEQHVDLFVSPSQSHLEQCLTRESWRRVEVSPTHPDGKVQWDPSSKPWAVVPLGCDPERYAGHAKVPGRVVYTSSPDRGLHLLLQEWPAIRRAVPHATLRIFYRTRAWIQAFEGTDYYPPIERQRARALYIEEALRRLDGHGVELFDAVSRATLEKELSQAEVLAYPADPANEYTEGFSCSTLEGCAARACPVITDADALGSIYGGAAVVVPRGKLDLFRNQVIACLQNEAWRNEVNDRAERFAQEHTWKATAEKLMAETKGRL